MEEAFIKVMERVARTIYSTTSPDDYKFIEFEDNQQILVITGADYSGVLLMLEEDKYSIKVLNPEELDATWYSISSETGRNILHAILEHLGIKED